MDGANKATRQLMEDTIYTFFDKLDPSGINSEKYREMFKDMSDAAFFKFFEENIFNDDYSCLTLDTVDYERDLTIQQVQDSADYLKVPLFEKMILPFANMDTNNPVVTKYEVPVGYIHIKRVQQLLFKKNSTSTDISQRSALTGQVTAKDKNGRQSDTENFALLALNSEHILKELMGPRADDMAMKQEMYAQISKKGFVSLEELPNNVDNKTTLNTLDVYLMGMGIKSDLVTSNLMVKKTINN